MQSSFFAKFKADRVLVFAKITFTSWLQLLSKIMSTQFITPMQ